MIRNFFLACTIAVEMLAGSASISLAQSSSDNADIAPQRWWKGNLHTHSLWSDGDDFPEMITQWYSERDYNFLALTDHNTLSQGMKWMRLDAIEARGGKVIFEKYLKRFGNDWVQTRGEPGSEEYSVRLKPIDEYRGLVEQTGKFILIQSEEISDRAQGKPVHINAANLLEAIQPVGGATVLEAMQNNLRAILEQESKTGRQILPHLNHPNFGYAITAEELAQVISERFFEVYNGHPGVNHLGDKDHISVERIWDVANTIRLVALNAAPLLGLGTDDSHEYHGLPGSRPGRGWVMVRSCFLTPEHLILAMKNGDFYASSGVTLDDVRYHQDDRRLSLKIKPEANVKYKTEFIASLRQRGSSADALPTSENIGKVVATSDSLEPAYSLTGNEIYVRAVVTSSLSPTDPVFENQKQQAWTQPVGWSTK